MRKFSPGSDLSKSRFLFLDRDGVINKKVIGGYVQNWSQLEFLPNVMAALKILTVKFERIFIITNQRGVGLGLMSRRELIQIHENLLERIERNGGKIDRIYFCEDISDNSFYRKPNIGLGLNAKSDFPEIVFFNSIMVGDSESDIIFGKTLGMKTVFISEVKGDETCLNIHPDYYFGSLFEFASSLSH